MSEPESSEVTQQLIPEGKMGSRTNPYEPVVGMEIKTIVSNAFYLADKWNAPCFFGFQGRIFQIDKEFSVTLEEGKGNKEHDKQEVEFVQDGASEVKEDWSKKRQEAQDRVTKKRKNKSQIG